MPVVLPSSRYPCLGTAEAEAFAAYLTETEELHSVATDGPVVTVDGLDMMAAMEVAELGVNHGWMGDHDGAAAIRAFEADPDKRWVDGPPGTPR
jgi:hypothetical protein